MKSPIHAYLHPNTYDKFLKVGQANRLETKVIHTAIESMDEFFLYSTRTEEDFLFAVAARNGSISNSSEIEGVLVNIQKIYEENDFVLIYPAQETDLLFKEYEDISGNAIGIGVDALSRIGKEVGSIFKKE